MGHNEIRANTKLSKKSIKKKPLDIEEKLQKREISKEGFVNENVIDRLKRFKILSDKYRNRRKRFELRFKVITGIYNFEVGRYGGNVIEG